MCIPGRARGAERTQRSSFNAEIRTKRSRRDGPIPFKSLPSRPFLVLLSNNVQKAVRVMLQPRGRDKRSEGGWLHRSFNSPVQIPYNTCGASAPPPRIPHPAPRNLDTDSIGACRGEADSRISKLTLSIQQTNVSKSKKMSRNFI